MNELSIFMKDLGYIWSEESQLYYHEKHRYTSIHDALAWYLYEKYNDLKRSDKNDQC